MPNTDRDHIDRKRGRIFLMENTPMERGIKWIQSVEWSQEHEHL